MEKKISCGALICSEKGFLALHPTGRKHEFGCYDIAKGCLENNDSIYETIQREIYEETGIVLEEIGQYTPVRFTNCGINSYLKEKDLALYIIEIQNTDKYFNFNCSSYFEEPKTGIEYPEMDGYKWTRDTKYYFKSLQNVLNKLREDNPIIDETLKKYEQHD